MRRFYSDPWSIYSVKFRRPKLNLHPQYQRGPTWSLGQRQRFIDSLLSDFDIPKFYLRKCDGSDSGYEWEVVDGQQRLTSIWGFLDNEFPLMVDSDKVEGHEVAGKFFNDLPDIVQDKLQSYGLTVVELEADNQEIEDMFLRLQDGDPLNSAEKRNAIFGNLRDFVHEIASAHKFFTSLVPIRNNRFAHDDLAAKMLRIEVKQGPTSLRHAELKKMYEDERGFNANSLNARDYKKVLNFLSRGFSSHGSYLTLLNAISLYTIASELLRNYSITSSTRNSRDFREWFISFEARRHESDPDTEDDRVPDFRTYEDALSNQTASVNSQRTRRNTLMGDYLALHPELVLRDEQRQFSSDQRYAIYVRSRGICSNPDSNPECVENCTLDNFHADHIEPHSAGGRTIVENGQLLCPSCNGKKSDSVSSDD